LQAEEYAIVEGFTELYVDEISPQLHSQSFML